MPDGPRAARLGIDGPAILWKRFDFRESSRVVTLLTRAHGRISALAKGAHRPDSPLLGRLDFLNDLQVRLSPDRGGLRLLLRAELVRERRELRAPRRYLAASHLVDLADFGFQAGQADPELFDLLVGGLTLVERCPVQALPVVVLGLEIRLLAHHGALPDLERCGACGRAFGAGGAFRGPRGDLLCRQHAGAPRSAVATAALEVLRRLRDQPARSWPDLAERLPGTAVALPGLWLAAALDQRSRLRCHVFAAE